MDQSTETKRKQIYNLTLMLMNEERLVLENVEGLSIDDQITEMARKLGHLRCPPWKTCDHIKDCLNSLNQFIDQKCIDCWIMWAEMAQSYST